MTINVITFGCRLNTYESEVIKSHLEAAGQKDVMVFNTCAVTAEAERQARQAIRRARRENPDVKIIVTGCSAQVKPQEYSGMSEVDLVLGNEEKLKAQSYSLLSTDFTEKALVNDIMSVKETAMHLIEGIEGRARAFVQVQNGCNHRCTFCIIPFGRGNSRSVPMGEVVSQVRTLVASGYNEVVLTGVDISDYGSDLPGTPTLGQMVRRLLAQVPELRRLRISSIDAVEVDEDLYRLIAEEPRLMPHLHVSLQSGDDMILKRMKRRHSRAQALEFCHRVRDLRPDMVFGADFITGFPTETDEMFENTLSMVQEAGITYLHVFPYSKREGTPAARMPQVAKQVRKERAERLRALGKQQVEHYYSTCNGQRAQVLIEQEYMGRTEGFAPVIVDKKLTAGSIHTVDISGYDTESLRGIAA